MADLSPAAQAVLDAATPALNNLDACGFNYQRYDRKALAAALRAAADQVGQVPTDLDSTEWRRGFSEGVRLAYRELYAIAAELEGHGQA